MNNAKLSIIRWASLCLICFCGCSQLQAQGCSIPKNSEAKEKEAAQIIEELPEGQKYRYQLLNGLNVSIDLLDPVLHTFFYDHASYEGQIMLDLHHRFFPMASFGMGVANETSNNGLEYGTDEKKELNFKSKLAPFAKFGMGYNLRYNDLHPDDIYMIFARYGWSHNKADITNLYYTSRENETWGAYGPASLTDQSYTSHWVEAGAMIKVQVWKRISLGWDLYWKIRISQTGTEFGDPYYVPGLGTSNSKVGFSFRLYYEIF